MSEQVKRLEQQCFEMKLKALDMALNTSFGAHIGGGFSAMELMACLYEVANIPSMAEESRDRIILSKGHGVLALYTALWKKGMITVEDLATFETDGTLFHGHAHRNLKKGIEFSGAALVLAFRMRLVLPRLVKIRG